MATRDVSIHSYITLIELAIANGYRTPIQQQHLLEECKTLDNVFVNWTAWAADTWAAKPCEACDMAVETTAGPICDACVEHERTHGTDLPGLAS